MFLTEFSGYDSQTDNWLNGMAAFFATPLGIRSEKQILSLYEYHLDKSVLLPSGIHLKHLQAYFVR